MSGTNGFPGQLGIKDVGSRFNHHDFHIDQKLGRRRTAHPVKVIAVNSDGSVDVQPLVNQVDGLGNSTPHGTVHNIQVHNFSGGNGTVLVTPAKGDMGLMVICDRDISAVVSAKGPANPGSSRQHDFSDGVYIGGFGSMNGTPSQSIVMTANGITITGNVTITGNLGVTGEVAAKSGGANIHLSTHTHGGGPHPDAGS